ncbi:MAG: retropepsin-like aspartic protease family protein [Tranquillimonas sp.]
MDQFDLPRLLYLGLLGAVIAGYFVVSNRHRMGQMAQQAAIWGLIFLGTIAAVGLWPDIRDSVVPRQSFVAGTGTVEVPRSSDGHYYLTLSVNGTPVDFVVDTGASDLVLSQRDALWVGLDPGRLAYIGEAQTANGRVALAQVVLDSVSLGDMTDTAVRATVNGGDMGTSLLGMSYLRRFGRIEIAGDRLVLER